MGPPRKAAAWFSPGSWGHPDSGELTRGETTESRVTVPFDDGAGRRREAPMSFRELSMIEIREVLRRWSAGQAVRAVARETGVDRKTVDRYVSAARELGAIARVRRRAAQSVS